ncbi:MAG TPA: N-acetylmuramoyl-L-alanine amidase [Clostridiales bacterium]|nr:N-acetylmuramoyl-L-alanine amidase [Clostridiales bacterium]
MIVVLKKSNIALVGLIFILLLAIYSLNINGGSKTAGNIPGELEEVSGKDGIGSIGDSTEGKKAITVTANDSKPKTVILDPGHGGEDPGAVSEYSGLREKDVTLKIAFKVKELLEKENYKVIITRTEDILQYEEGTTDIYQKRKQDLSRRKSIMDDSGADIVVSIHLNKFPETQYYGAQVFYPPESPESRKLANIIQSTLKEKVDPSNKRVAMEKTPPQGQKPIMILRDVKTTTVIVECGFLSNLEEEKKLGSGEYQDILAAAIKDGISMYFND